MVIWSDPAKEDLKRIFEYIAQDSTYYASKVASEIVGKSDGLHDFPEQGRIVPEIGNPSIRELIVYAYRLIYEVGQDNIEVLALIHGKRDFSSGEIDKLRK